MIAIDQNRLVQRTRLFSFADVTFYTLMVAFGEAMIMLYVARESGSNLSLAFLTSIPTAIGALAQIIAPRLLFSDSPRRLLLGGHLLFTVALDVFCPLWLPRRPAGRIGTLLVRI